jgi:Dolichyl-phosphate-mannose-protein mannosyltransferase
LTTASQHQRRQGAGDTGATSPRDVDLNGHDEQFRPGASPLSEGAPASSRKHWIWLLVLILLIAALPRVWGLMSSGFRGDEAVYAGQAGILSGDGELDRFFVLTSRGNSNFLLYQEIVGAVYFLFGVSDLAARLVSVFFSIGTVLVTFELARTLYGRRRLALVAALGVALSGYAVMLGRLALLDATLTFLFTLTLLAFAKWLRSGSRAWFLCLAASASLTLQAKVTGVLVLLACFVYLLISRELRRLRWSDLALGSLVFCVFLTPVVIQAVSNSHQFFQFLHDSSARVTTAPWHYYLDKLGQFNGYPLLAVWALGIGVALKQRRTGDRLLLTCTIVLAVFFQTYPLKAFNYLLPAIPVLAILGARGLYSVGGWIAQKFDPGADSLNGPPRGSGLIAPIAAAAVLVAVSIGPVVDAARTDSYFGLREAAKWLERNTPEDTGVMTLSKGSAQYALSFYSKRDAYPFGRFRLATIFPGPKVLSPRPDPQGGPSRDWISYWPPRLIGNRTVSYLVYYTDEGDDPPEAPIVESEQQTTFRNFIESYGGKLVHTIRRDHEGRAWIYRITELRAEPEISFARRGGQVVVTGHGFRFNSRARVYYHRVPRGWFNTDRNGSFKAKFPYPFRVSDSYWMVALDDAGNVASGTGLTGSGKLARSHAKTASGKPGAGKAAPRPAGPLNLAVKAPKQVPVGSTLSIVVHVQAGKSRSTLVSRANVSLVLRSTTTRVTSVRLNEKQTNQLGDAYFNLAALELPGIYRMSVEVTKGGQRGASERMLKVRRR